MSGRIPRMIEAMTVCALLSTHQKAGRNFCSNMGTCLCKNSLNGPGLIAKIGLCKKRKIYFGLANDLRFIIIFFRKYETLKYKSSDSVKSYYDVTS